MKAGPRTSHASIPPSLTRSSQYGARASSPRAGTLSTHGKNTFVDIAFHVTNRHTTPFLNAIHSTRHTRKRQLPKAAAFLCMYTSRFLLRRQSHYKSVRRPIILSHKHPFRLPLYACLLHSLSSHPSEESGKHSGLPLSLYPYTSKLLARTPFVA